jgi:hypothetical protein
MLAESLVLGTAAHLLGLALAKLGIDLLVSIAPASFPRVDDVSIDGMVLGFTVALAVLSALIFRHSYPRSERHAQPVSTLRSGGRAPGLQAGKYLRHGVVIAEVTLSFVLLIGSGLMLRSFMVLENVDPGFDPKGVLTFTAFNNRARTPGESQAYGNTLEQAPRRHSRRHRRYCSVADAARRSGCEHALGPCRGPERSFAVPASHDAYHSPELFPSDARATSSPADIHAGRE